MTAGRNNSNNSEDRPRTGCHRRDRAAFRNTKVRANMSDQQTTDTTTDPATPSPIGISPEWALDAVLDHDAGTVLHSREGSIVFHAATDVLSKPLVPQRLRLEVADRLKLQGTDGLTCVRDGVEVCLVQAEDDGDIEVVVWPLQEARALHVALGQILAVHDGADGVE